MATLYLSLKSVSKRNVENNEGKGRNHYCKSTSSTDQMGYNIMLELVIKAP